MIRTMGKQVAMAAREQQSGEFWAAWWLEIALGRDPRVTLRDVDPKTNKRRVGGPSKSTIIEQLPTLQDSMMAQQALALRAYGQPPKKEDVDREVAGAGAAQGDVAGVFARLAALPVDEVRTIIRALRTAAGAEPSSVQVEASVEEQEAQLKREAQARLEAKHASQSATSSASQEQKHAFSDADTAAGAQEKHASRSTDTAAGQEQKHASLDQAAAAAQEQKHASLLTATAAGSGGGSPRPFSSAASGRGGSARAADRSEIEVLGSPSSGGAQDEFSPEELARARAGARVLDAECTVVSSALQDSSRDRGSSG